MLSHQIIMRDEIKSGRHRVIIFANFSTAETQTKYIDDLKIFYIISTTIFIEYQGYKFSSVLHR